MSIFGVKSLKEAFYGYHMKQPGKAMSKRLDIKLVLSPFQLSKMSGIKNAAPNYIQVHAVLKLSCTR